MMHCVHSVCTLWFVDHIIQLMMYGFIASGGIDEFGYVEFNGKGGRTCPTCKGTGRIAKGSTLC